MSKKYPNKAVERKDFFDRIQHGVANRKCVRKKKGFEFYFDSSFLFGAPSTIFVKELRPISECAYGAFKHDQHGRMHISATLHALDFDQFRQHFFSKPTL